MKLTRGQKILCIINLLGIGGFTAYYLSIRNYEFLWYIIVMVIFFLLILFTLHKSKFGYDILIGLSLWGFLHMAGGGIQINCEALYALHLIPIAGEGNMFVLKFDQLVHLIGFGVATLVGYHLLRPYLKKQVNWKVLYPLIVLIGMGIGALNEIIEFIAVLLVPETGVGGYENTMLDIVFNTIGAIIATVIIHFRENNLERKGGSPQKKR